MEYGYFLLKPPSLKMKLAPSVFEFLFKAGFIVSEYSEHEISLEAGLQIYTPETRKTDNYHTWKYVLQALTVQGRCGLIQVWQNSYDTISILEETSKAKGKLPYQFNPFTIRGKFSPYTYPETRQKINELMRSSPDELSRTEMIIALSQYPLDESIAHTPDNLHEQNMLLEGIALCTN